MNTYYERRRNSSTANNIKQELDNINSNISSLAYRKSIKYFLAVVWWLAHSHSQTLNHGCVPARARFIYLLIIPYVRLINDYLAKRCGDERRQPGRHGGPL